jgi:cellulose synthase/poly-beta-1,6-N-acetylglucosamine synthase-like glycosyltransferase
VFAAGDIRPAITFIVVAHNEVGVIRKKIENLLSLEYPRELLRIILASDGSTDGTDEVIKNFCDPHLMLLSLPKRGKIPSLNAALSCAEGELIVFSDANSIFKPDALQWLVRPFADLSVGGVAGNQSYLGRQTGAGICAGEITFWNFDQFLKQCQSAAGSITSATGAIYAIRRELLHPIPGGVGDDAFNSYQVIAQGKRLVYEPRAIAYEAFSPSVESEFQRKVRVCARGLVGLRHAAGLFNPFRYGFYSLQLFSHKLLRWSMVAPLAVLFLCSLLLIRNGWFYGVMAVAQTGFYALALLFHVRRETKTNHRALKLLSFPFYFCLANVAFLRAQVLTLRGHRIDSWRITRNETA